jgi:RHS repeat-associated protein
VRGRVEGTPCGYGTAGQVLTRQDTSGGYTARPAAVSSAYATNGLNQYTSASGATQTYSGANSAALTYDALGRPRTETSSGGATTFLYDGSNLIGEYGVNGQILNRYVTGPGTDEPLTWYSGSGTSSRAWYAADNAGSVIATADQNANATATYDYGPYGEPITSAGASAWGGSRYRYTGQIEIPGARSYYYKARVYDPGMGRFHQTDPVGYSSDVNIYAYVTNDPINWNDPSGLRIYTNTVNGITAVCDSQGAATQSLPDDADDNWGTTASPNTFSGNCVYSFDGHFTDGGVFVPSGAENSSNKPPQNSQPPKPQNTHQYHISVPSGIPSFSMAPGIE